MKKRNLQRIFAAFMATAMAMSMAACGEKEAEKPADEGKKDEPAKNQDDTNKGGETVAPTEDPNAGLLIDPATGKPYDLGGMEIIIRDWWSGDGTRKEPTNDFEEARLAWIEECEKTYNFTVKEMAISDWGSCPQDFVDYATNPDDGNNYVFTLRADAAIVNAMGNGLMYPLDTLDCLDFDAPMFQNKTHTLWQKGGHIYGMNTGFSEARTGVIFNKTVLKDAGIDPESLYDMQANGTWDWNKFEEIMTAVQRDVDNDGTNDYWGLTLNEGVMTQTALASNGGSYFEMKDGKFVVNVNSPESVQALEWCVDMYTKFDQHDPEGAQWDYYKEEFNTGKIAFCVDQAYNGSGNQFLDDANFEVGFVMFPKSPYATGRYINIWDNNIFAIPANYSADKAWKIAFAYSLYKALVPGYEDYMDLSNYRAAGIFDDRAISETIPMMMQGEHGCMFAHNVLPNLNLGEEFEWGIAPNAVVSEKIDAVLNTWQAYCDAANK